MNWNAKSTKIFTPPSSWQLLPNGDAYCNALTQYFKPWFTKILGHQILKLGGLSGEIEADLPLRHQIVVTEKIPENHTALSSSSILQDETQSYVQAKLTELPFIQKSLDACLLANTLNFSQDPHQILREAHRVLTDDGYLFISLFNPFSLISLKPRLGQFAFRQYCTWRIIDWLALLNFDILVQQNLAITNKPYSWLPPLTVIVAQKRTYPINLNLEKERLDLGAFLEPAGAFKEISTNTNYESSYNEEVLPATNH